jgi:hypothetical protein
MNAPKIQPLFMNAPIIQLLFMYAPKIQPLFMNVSIIQLLWTGWINIQVASSRKGTTQTQIAKDNKQETQNKTQTHKNKQTIYSQFCRCAS